MSGDSYLFDTNAILYLIHGSQTIQNSDAIVFISFITEIELLAYNFLSEAEEKIIHKLLNEIEIINIDSKIKEKTIEIRKKSNVKIPDAIICATAFSVGLTLITNDERLHKIDEIRCCYLSEITG